MNVQPRNTNMPLMMMFTNPTPVITEDSNRHLVYNPLTQMVEIDMRLVGTRSLRSSSTKKGKGTSHTDRKNEIDDSKSVK